MLLLILGYMLFGFCAILGAVTIHFFRADAKGYDVLKWWRENYDLKHPLSTNSDKFGFVVGLLLWPIRLVNFLNIIPNLYEQYEPIQHEGMSQQ